MKKARIELILEVIDEDMAAIKDLVNFQKDIEEGVFQRDFTQIGIRKATATFEWLEK